MLDFHNHTIIYIHRKKTTSLSKQLLPSSKTCKSTTLVKANSRTKAAQVVTTLTSAGLSLLAPKQSVSCFYLFIRRVNLT